MASTVHDLPGPRRLPLLGNALHTKPTRLHLDLERWADEYGPIYRMALGPVPIVVITDRDTVNAVLRQRPDGYRRWKNFADIVAEVGAEGLFTGEGAAWRRWRRLSVTALNADYLHRYYDVIARSVTRLHGVLDRAAADRLDLRPLFHAYAIDVATALAFGQDVNALEHGDHALVTHVSLLMDTVGRRMKSPVPYWRWVRLPADRRGDRSMAALHALAAELIAQARRNLAERADGVPANFLEGMLSAPDHFSDAELVGNVLTTLIAGEDTTANTLAWAAWYLAQRPDVQARLRAEAAEVLGDSPVPDYAATTRLTYAEAVVREAARLRSPVPLLGLEPLADIELLGVALPAGTRLGLMLRHVSTQEGSFERSKDFDPDRWLTGTADPKGHLPFGAGPRVCPGRNLAYLEAKSALAMLAHAFEIAPDPTAEQPHERFGATMRPTAVPVRLRPRTTRTVLTSDDFSLR